MVHLQLFKRSKENGKRSRCFFWGCLQRSNPCVIFPRREVLPLIANRLCTLAMCGVSLVQALSSSLHPQLPFNCRNPAGPAGGPPREQPGARMPSLPHSPRSPDRLLPTRAAKQPSLTSSRDTFRAFHPGQRQGHSVCPSEPFWKPGKSAGREVAEGWPPEGTASSLRPPQGPRRHRSLQKVSLGASQVTLNG